MRIVDIDDEDIEENIAQYTDICHGIVIIKLKENGGGEIIGHQQTGS